MMVGDTAPSRRSMNTKYFVCRTGISRINPLATLLFGSEVLGQDRLCPFGAIKFLIIILHDQLFFRKGNPVLKDHSTSILRAERMTNTE